MRSKGTAGFGDGTYDVIRLLFVKLKHIGDALLLTPTLTAVKAAYPTSEIWVAVRRGTEGILGGCPSIDRIVTTAAAEARNRKISDLLKALGLIREIRKHRFDYAFELSDGDRGRLLTGLCGARRRCANVVNLRLPSWARFMMTDLSAFDWSRRHRVEKDFFTVKEFLPLSEPVPELCFAPERTQPWPPGERLTDFVVIHPATRWRSKQWPKDRWIEISRRLLQVLPNVIISSGPDPGERRFGSELCAALGRQSLHTDGQANWNQLAWILYRAKLLLSVDTAAMHLAAACQCPSVVIFGPSIPYFWRPWRAPHRLVLAPEAQRALLLRDYPEGVPEIPAHTVEVEAVVRACEEIWREQYHRSLWPIG